VPCLGFVILLLCQGDSSGVCDLNDRLVVCKGLVRDEVELGVQRLIFEWISHTYGICISTWSNEAHIKEALLGPRPKHMRRLGLS